ncbi:DUF1294 domain-containing protein [Massilia niabensis]|uniref:DUF1294 domain-containing protein n=1 Tax=Massilia niabensis TaxID=544910 RepID=A0ABW0LAD4_9BURK
MMRGNPTPRYQGKITSWKDDQGFGFISPNGGGPAVFVHIKSFANRGPRPANDDIVTYELGSNEKGQPRAEHVSFARARASRPTAPRPSGGSLVTAAGFLALVAAFVVTGTLPPVVLGAYLGLSAAAFIAYAFDKSAAQNNEWRTPESTLHMFGLVGGWPGALLAQQLLRHKSKKESFRTMFWLTVAANCAALGWLLSPSGSDALRSILASA